MWGKKKILYIARDPFLIPVFINYLEGEQNTEGDRQGGMLKKLGLDNYDVISGKTAEEVLVEFKQCFMPKSQETPKKKKSRKPQPQDSIIPVRKSVQRLEDTISEMDVANIAMLITDIGIIQPTKYSLQLSIPEGMVGWELARVLRNAEKKRIPPLKELIPVLGITEYSKTIPPHARGLFNDLWYRNRYDFSQKMAEYVVWRLSTPPSRDPETSPIYDPNKRSYIMPKKTLDEDSKKKSGDQIKRTVVKKPISVRPAISTAENNPQSDSQEPGKSSTAENGTKPMTAEQLFAELDDTWKQQLAQANGSGNTRKEIEDNRPQILYCDGDERWRRVVGPRLEGEFTSHNVIVSGSIGDAIHKLTGMMFYDAKTDTLSHITERLSQQKERFSKLNLIITEDQFLGTDLRGWHLSQLVYEFCGDIPTFCFTNYGCIRSPQESRGQFNCTVKKQLKVPGDIGAGAVIDMLVNSVRNELYRRK